MNLTCVSGYWNVKNKYDNKFYDWFNTTLKINCPYVFFCSKSTINIIKKYRARTTITKIICEDNSGCLKKILKT